MAGADLVRMETDHPTLAKRFAVIAPDLRGLGDSSKPLSGYDKRTVASDSHQLVRDWGLSGYSSSVMIGELGLPTPMRALPRTGAQFSDPGNGNSGFRAGSHAAHNPDGGLWHMVFLWCPTYRRCYHW
jgi:hypothetical protein